MPIRKRITPINGLREFSPERLNRLLRFDPVSGKLFWRERPFDKSFNTKYSGKEAGWVCGQGYINVTIEGVHYLAHRIAWAMYYGQWPTNDIDHKNRNKADNRIKNLRDVTNSVNHRNLRVRCDNSSGVTGVTKRGNRWRAQIQVNGKTHYLGSYFSKRKAIEARRAAETKFDFYT